MYSLLSMLGCTRAALLQRQRQRWRCVRPGLGCLRWCPTGSSSSSSSLRRTQSIRAKSQRAMATPRFSRGPDRGLLCCSMRVAGLFSLLTAGPGTIPCTASLAGPTPTASAADTADGAGFEASSGQAAAGGAIHVSGSPFHALLTTIVGNSGVEISLPAAPLSLWRRGRMLLPGAGLSASAPAVASNGTDAVLGPFVQYEQAWLCAGEETEGPCLITSVRVLQNRPAAIWRQEWPRGMTHTEGTPSLATPNQALCAFPAFQGGSRAAKATNTSEFAAFHGNNNSDSAGSAGGAATSGDAVPPLQLGDLGFINWATEFAVTPAWRAGRWPIDYGQWAGDWGMYSSALTLFDTRGRTLVVGPLTGFTSFINALYNGTGLATGPHGMVETLPAGFVMETVIVLGNGVVQTQMDYGSLLLDAHGKQRALPDVSTAVESLMYSADGYPYYDPASGNSTCGNYEDLYLALAKSDAAQHLPYRTSMLDSFWYGQAVHNGVWRWDADSPCFQGRFPHGLPWLRGNMGVDFVAHLGTWLKDSPYTSSYAFVDDPLSNYSLPTDQAFWDDLFRNATHGPRGWGLSVMKQDHQDQQIGCVYRHAQDGGPLCHRWAGMTDPIVTSNWLAQMARGAHASGVTIEYGTTIARFVLNTVTLPAETVTHVRGANDYTPRAVNDSWRIGAAAGLFWSVGLYTTKDTFLSSTNETTPSGGLHNYHELYPELHAAVSAISAGPVSPSDGPGDANVSLIMRTCRTDGVLLKPDAPAMPLDNFWIGSAFCNGGGDDLSAASRVLQRTLPLSHEASPATASNRDDTTTSTCPVPLPPRGELWATATRIGDGAGAMVWPIVFSQLTSGFRLRLPTVFAHLRSVPSIHRDGSVAPATWQPPEHGWVLFRPGAPLHYQPPRVVNANDTIGLTAGATYGDFTLFAMAPVVRGYAPISSTVAGAGGSAGAGPDWALLGETDKFVPVSQQRIVDVVAGASQLVVAVVGAAAEVVTLRVALVDPVDGAAATPNATREAHVARARALHQQGPGSQGAPRTVRRVLEQTVTLGKDGQGTVTFAFKEGNTRHRRQDKDVGELNAMRERALHAVATAARRIRHRHGHGNTDCAIAVTRNGTRVCY